MSCHEVREALGAYVLGRLEPDEVRQVSRHLAACAGCREERDLLAELPPFLARVPTELAVQGPPEEGPSDRLLGRLLTAVAAERVRRRRLQMVGAAAAVLLVLGGIAAAVAYGPAGGGSSDASPGSRVVATVDPVTQVRADLTLRPTVWGSRLSMRLAGVPAGSTCQLVAVGKGGQREIAATYKVPEGGYASDRSFSVDGAIGMVPDDVDAVEVVSQGRTLVVVRP